MKADRIFYSTTAVLILAITLIGFRAFFTTGQADGGRIIDPRIYPFVIVHGLSVTAWYVLSLVQTLLMAGNNRRLHMKLGWSSVGLVPVITSSGLLVAIFSAAGAPAGFIFFGMPYKSQFLWVMVTEILVFTVLATTGIVYRKRPELHRAMMVSASLSLLLGATARMPWLNALFGGDTPVGFFGPVFALGAGLVLVNSLRRGRFDRPLATGYVTMVVMYLLAAFLGSNAVWQQATVTWLN